jgi:response regulator RpfG family c-di-GMP phosphodiesterase
MTDSPTSVRWVFQPVAIDEALATSTDKNVHRTGTKFSVERSCRTRQYMEVFAPMPASETTPSVLIIDQSDDTRDVLRTILQRRGVSVFEAGAAAAGVELARRHHPEVIVMDGETVPDQDTSSRDQIDNETATRHSQLLVLGKVRRDSETLRNGEFVAKPYHYGPLVRKIEQFIESSTVARRAA